MSETVTAVAATPVSRLTATVRGRVQGVGFRYWAHHTAEALAAGVAGEVRNMPDGAVELVAEAPRRETLERLERELHQGPTTAHVDGVDAVFEEGVAPRFAGAGFRVV